MAQKVPSPRHILARNLKSLIKDAGLTIPEVARRAGVDRKTVWNQANARTDPQPERVALVAKVFDLEASMLLSDAFLPEIVKDANFKKLLALYAAANEDGKNLILRVAEAAPRKTG